MLIVIAFYRSCSDLQWPADLLHVSDVLLAAGLFISAVFAAQLFLIHQIERGHLFRRRQSPHG